MVMPALIKPRNLKSLERLDDIDLQILSILQENGRTSNADLARKVKLSPPSVLQRVRKLEESGLITDYVAILNAQILGFGLMVLTKITLESHQEKTIEKFRESVTRLPNVLEVFQVSGDFDFLLKIRAANMADYERIVRESVSPLPGVGRIESNFVLAVGKSTAALPI